ncbi:hypothetical protein CAP35_13015 [Chitinophagaceae bacterium IBVUCB1]|nr:hypothetical protein CAP35_13015 [Chitinophagaceae bacterium IBVUCB1]
MKTIPSSTEDIFVREMILHGNKERAARAAFPRMLPECIPAAIQYMMDNPEVRHRIDAGILYYYKDYFPHINVPDMQPITADEKRTLLQRIVLRTYKQPRYIRTEDGLRMIMVQPDNQAVSDAAYMLEDL